MAIEFILNNNDVKTEESAGQTLLDFIRYQQQLTGTKIGCREGDCGACTILIGQFIDGQLQYESMTSCITPLGNANGKHIVTIEGLNMEDKLSPVQQSMVDFSGSQCGFCTPGFVVSMTSCCMSSESITEETFKQTIDGNICRCTGYIPMLRASSFLTEKLKDKNIENPIQWAVEHKFIPPYFNSISDRLDKIKKEIRDINPSKQIVGGGTDLYVQKHDDMHDADIDLIFNDNSLQGIRTENDKCIIGGGTTASQLLNSDILKEMFPKLKEHLLLVSSTPIRNMGTIAGNLVNASPIGDLTAYFLALNSQVILKSSDHERSMNLKDFYLGYKDIDMTADEIIQSLSFDTLTPNTYFNFEKVSKRTYLDIASVNSGILISTDLETVQDVHISAGGVGPTPKYLDQTRQYLIGKTLTSDTVRGANDIIQGEISPISDARGSESYKRLLLRQLFFSHFIELFPSIFSIQNLTT